MPRLTDHRWRTSAGIRTVGAVLLMVGCTQPVVQTPDPAVRETGTPWGPEESPVPPPRQPVAPPQFALAQGWMPLDATGVPAFRDQFPTYDGRGILVGILDSGLDPGVPGLNGRERIVDLRDFSEEGHVVLSPVRIDHDTVWIEGASMGMRGAGRLRALSLKQQWFGGVLDERQLGQPPAADLNGNGVPGEQLPVVVARATDGWFVLVDTDGDGSLGNESPVSDYAVAH